MPDPSPERGPTVTAADGVELVTWDLGGEGPSLLLAHATGFHGRLWAPLAAELGERHRVWAYDQRGHGSSGHAPDGRYDDWGVFADDLIAVVEALDSESLVDADALHGAGHSMGAAVLVLAEQRRPMFRSLYCYEPIIVAPPGPGEAPRPSHLSDLARRRRETFESIDAARANYAGKPPYSRFSPAALDAYVEGAFTPRADGRVGLCCRGEEEASVYRGAFVHDAYQHLGRIGIPVTVACGEHGGDLGLELLVDLAGRIPNGRLEPMSGCSHFGPMEAPEQVAAAIIAAGGDPHPPGQQLER